jgi:hypothetical protein
MAMRMVVLGLGLAAFFCAGCGPIQASSAITRADDSLREARTRGWDKECPYEITAADGYLTAARDLAGRAEFDVAREFADKAAQLASSTRDLAPRNARLRESRGKAAPGDPSGKAVPPADGRSGGTR